MQPIGTLTGTGGLLVDGEIVTSADYEITVWLERPGGLKSANGLLYGDFAQLHKVFEARSADLQLESGETVRIIITQLSTDSPATIQVSGPVPGY